MAKALEIIRRQRTEWDPSIFEHEAFRYFTFSQNLLNLNNWPTLEILNKWFEQKDIRTARNNRLTVIPPRKRTRPTAPWTDFYEPSVYLRGELMVKPNSVHDICNVLVWLEFAQTKLLLNEMHFKEFSRQNPEPVASLSNRRSALQDCLTLIDEGGVLHLGDSKNPIYVGHGALECLAFGYTDFSCLELKATDTKSDASRVAIDKKCMELVREKIKDYFFDCTLSR